MASETVRTFLRFFLKIQTPDFTLFDLLHALFRTLDMLAFAAAAPSVQLSIDISCRPGPQQQTRRTLLRRSITGADTVTADGRTPFRYTDPAACYMRAGSGVLGGIRGYMVTGVLLSVDQSRGTVYLWHCDQVTSRRRLSEDI